MPRKKNWKVGRARKDTIQRHGMMDTGVLKISDGGLAHPVPSSSIDVRPSVSVGGVCDLSDGGLAHPQKPSVSIGGIDELSDGGFAHPQKPSVSMEGVNELSDGGFAHPQKPSVSIGGVNELSDGGLAHPQKPSVSLSSAELCFNANRAFELNSDWNLCENSGTVIERLFHTSLSIDNYETIKKCDGNTSQNISLTDTTVNNPSDKLPISLMYTAFPIKGTAAEIEQTESSSFNPQSLVFGSFHQAHQMFSVHSRGNQCTANALCSLIYTKFAQLTSKQNLDSVLIDGDLLYRNIVLGLKSRGVFKSILLNFDEIPNGVTILNRNVSIEKFDVISGVCIQQNTTSGLPSLHQSLDAAFQISSYLLVMIGSVCSAVFKKKDMYHLFDSHSHGSDGMSSVDGQSILASFQCVDDLVTFMYGMYESMLIDIEAQFDMLPLRFTINYASLIDDSRSKIHDRGQPGPLCKEDTPMLLRRYFRNQLFLQKCKKDHLQENTFSKTKLIQDRKHQKRNEYMKHYMRNKRLSHVQKIKDRSLTLLSMTKVRQSLERKNKERLMTKQSKRKSRQTSERQSKERFMTKVSKQKYRQVPERQEKERTMTRLSKRKTRQVPERQEKERMMTRVSKQRSRQVPERQEKERTMTKGSMQKSRQAPERQEKERLLTKMSKHQSRKAPERREKERTMSKVSKQKSRKAPERREKERTMSKVSKQKSRQAPERREKERTLTKVSKHKYRQAPERQEKERTLTKVSKQKSRQAPERQEKERTLTKLSKQKSRQAPERQEKERTFTKVSKQKSRQAPERQEKERTMTKVSKQKSRQAPERRERERVRTFTAMHKCRASKFYQEGERLKKQSKRAIKVYKEKEKERNTLTRHDKRNLSEVCSREKRIRHLEKYGKSIDACIGKFNKAISEGPVFVCTCCHQTWFRHSVIKADKVKHKISGDKVKVFTQYKSFDDCEWICNTCLDNLKQNKIPQMSVINKNSFPVRPNELELHQLEERLVSLRIPFMQIRELPRGGQLSIKGNVVNVPVDIQPVINSLPRSLDSYYTIPVKLKKKMSYKTCDFTENIRPLHVISALQWLINHSDLYKESGITIDDCWLNSVITDSNETVREFLGINSDNTDVAENQYGSDDDHDSDHFSEIDETEKVVGNSDTMLDEADPSNDNVYTFAPGEGQTPLSLYQDENAEYMSFPTIFCGQKRAPNHSRDVPIHYSDICKLELRHIDRRVAANIPNIFFKLKKVQLKQVSDKVHLALRRCKTQGKSFTASDMLNTNCLHNMVRLDEGYYIFRSLRNSPPYFEARKKDVFAMIRQLGLPTWFMSLSSADTRWCDLLNMLSKINDGQTLTAEDINRLSWTEKAKLVQKDPVTCVRYFDHRVQEFINTVLRSHHEPLGKVVDYFYRVEFQQRGSPHIHMLIWISNAPNYNTHTIEEVTAFVDKYVSCNKDSNEQLVEFQVHKHSKSCRKKEKAVCRFGFPAPPMNRTTILEPLSDPSAKKQYNDLYARIQKQLDEVKNKEITYKDFLSLVDVEEDDYIKAIQSSLNGPKLFLKRSVTEARVNPYMKPILNAWGANHDLQFVLDPYACAVYIVSYMSKAQRGMSVLMSEACKEARHGNMDLRRQVRHIGNKFLNSVEVSAQEACYLLLQLPLTKSTRDVVFINTSTPEERTFLLKSKEALEKLPPDSTNIEADNIIKRYSKRPKALENWCLADYVSQLEVKYGSTDNRSKNVETQGFDQLQTPCQSKEDGCDTSTNDDEMQIFEDDSPDVSDQEVPSTRIPKGGIILKNGIVISERKQRKVIRYVRFSKKVDIENFCRERLLLFTPWRNEETDLIQGQRSYQSRYLSLKNFIEKKAHEYEKNADELDDALERAENEENFDVVAPGSEQVERDDTEIGAKYSSEFIYFDPDRPENQRQYDIARDVGLAVSTVEISIRRKTMPDLKFKELVNSLNVKQREFFVHILQTVKINKEKLHLFLSGGAGVGKSVLVTALFEALQRYLTSDPGDNPDNTKILLCAPTGKAAFHINGVTLHSAFRIPASQGYDCSPLSSDVLNTLRTKYNDLAVVMIDEVSMVGNNMLKLINERLKQIKGSILPFGGLHMIFIGDLFQLKPVMDGWIFENLKRNFGPLASNLWQDLIDMHELDEIMRQKNDQQFAEILNRLREGKHTENDLEVLKGRLTDTFHPEYPDRAVHLFNTNESVHAFNTKTYQKVSTEKVNICSLDHVLGDDNPEVKQQLLSKLPSDSTHTAGLSNRVGIAVGMMYDLCLNLDVDDGLVNGSTCRVTKIEYRQKATGRPSIIWVAFNNADIGAAWRSKYHHLFHSAIDCSWTPIFDCKRNFVYLRKTFIRIQIPLRLSMAKTVHKSQGDTLSQVVIDMSGKRVFSHAHYVAISRSRTLEGLHILNLNETKISVSDKVKTEMKRLRETRLLKLCYTPVYHISNNHFKCMFHNVQSLRKHKDDFFSDPNVQAADILGVVETWLTDSDSTESLQQAGYQMFRADGFREHNSRPHRGIVVYVRDSLTVLHNYCVTKKDIEMLVLTVQHGKQQTMVATLYRSPGSSTKDVKSFLMDNLYEQSREKHLIIQGDFNINILHDTSSTVSNFIVDVFSCQQIVQKPTHYSGSLIDHIYTGMQFVVTDVIECVWSDHSLVYVAFPKLSSE